MLIRQILATLLLLSLSIGSSPVAVVWLFGDDTSHQHSSDQPLSVVEEETEKQNSEWDGYQVLDSGLFTTAVEQIPPLSLVRYDGSHWSTQPLLTGPDHSRAPPVRA